MPARHDPPKPQEIRDPRALRAIAHPLRIALLELIGRERQLTATRASELCGESVASCSFHLRQLAKYGFVEEVPDVAGRDKPWRLVATSHSWSSVEDDLEQAVAARVLTSVLASRELESFEQWLDERRDYAQAWQRSAIVQQSLLYLTPAELARLSSEIEALLTIYLERIDPVARPKRTKPVRFFATAYPIKPTDTGN